MAIGLLDITQTDYLVSQLFRLDMQPHLIRESNKQFLIKAPFMMIFLLLLKFFVVEIIPGFFGLAFTLLFYYLVIYVIYNYFLFLNEFIKKNGFIGLVIFVLPLIFLVLVL